jgi:transcriptional regulator with XRE-family HTH domain
MTPAELIAWRKRLGLTAKSAAAELGLSINGYAAYERGTAPDGRRRPIPRHVELATRWLERFPGH